MDSRELKKHILYDMATDYLQKLDFDKEHGNYQYVIATVYDKDELELTKAEIKRFEKVLRKIVDNFYSKLN